MLNLSYAPTFSKNIHPPRDLLIWQKNAITHPRSSLVSVDDQLVNRSQLSVVFYKLFSVRLLETVQNVKISYLSFFDTFVKAVILFISLNFFLQSENFCNSFCASVPAWNSLKLLLEHCSCFGPFRHNCN